MGEVVKLREDIEDVPPPQPKKTPRLDFELGPGGGIRLGISLGGGVWLGMVIGVWCKQG